ncbi:hypothetical protein SESBI_14132 [Sesbania bispinosa]|nr:hypothetical protein SESBI_14132 [Sesbania bispinosa]
MVRHTKTTLQSITRQIVKTEGKYVYATVEEGTLDGALVAMGCPFLDFSFPLLFLSMFSCLSLSWLHRFSFSWGQKVFIFGGWI